MDDSKRNDLQGANGGGYPNVDSVIKKMNDLTELISDERDKMYEEDIAFETALREKAEKNNDTVLLSMLLTHAQKRGKILDEHIRKVNELGRNTKG